MGKKNVKFGDKSKPKENKKWDKKSKDNETLKNILTKMVPYINIPYAEHVLKEAGADPNAKATDKDIDVLIKAAKACQDIVRNLEQQEGNIKGFLIYTEKPAPSEKKVIPVLSTGELPE